MYYILNYEIVVFDETVVDFYEGVSQFDVIGRGIFVFAKNRVNEVQTGVEIVGVMAASELVGLFFRPVFSDIVDDRFRFFLAQMITDRPDVDFIFERQKVGRIVLLEIGGQFDEPILKIGYFSKNSLNLE